MKTLNKIILFFTLIIPLWSSAQFVTVNGNKFMVDGKEIIMNGANTPWNNWNDFGGNYISSWWDSEFQNIKAAGGNSTRIWITCSGTVGINISADGTVTGATDAFWTNLDDMFRLAQKNKIYVKATLISFDHFKSSNSKFQNWRNMVMSDDKVATFADNYVIPFLTRFKGNPYLWAIDICNEIEWVNQEADKGQIPWSRLQYFVARVASTVHDNSNVLVTLGSGAIKWNSDKFEGNYWSDAKLKAQYNKDNARLDFYSPHFYGWSVKWFGNFALNKTPADYGINDRPCIVGENPAKGVFNDGANPTLEVPASQMFLSAYNKGWKGLMPWTSNGVDSNGTLKDFESGLQAFKTAHPELVDPSYTTGMIPELERSKGSKILKNVFPNPTNSGGFNIVLSDYKDVILHLTDYQGSLIFDKKAESTEISFSSNALPKGMYVLSAIKNGWVENCKLVLN
jgi:hypothetical protein